jgi:hypothetical protein
MTAATIVKDLDVLEQRLTSRIMRRVVLMVNQLGLESPKETLDDGVVIAVAGAAHARTQAVPGQLGLELVAGVLNSPIAVEQ